MKRRLPIDKPYINTAYAVPISQPFLVMAKTSFCAPRLFFRKRPKSVPAQQGVEKMGKNEGSSKPGKADISNNTAKGEGSQGVKKSDKGGLGQPLYQPKDGEANVEYVCHCASSQFIQWTDISSPQHCLRPWHQR